MKSIPGKGRPHNPFSSARVRPGAIPYRFTDDFGVQDLLMQLESAGMIGQIIGPHGSGKSTLLRSLGEALAVAGRAVVFAETKNRIVHETRDTILLLDGGERIPPRRIREAARWAQKSGGGLITTAHADLGLPTLFRTSMTPELACRIVRELTAESRVKVHEELICRALIPRDGNLRLALFDLYDWYEEAARNLPKDPIEIDGVENPTYHK